MLFYSVYSFFKEHLSLYLLKALFVSVVAVKSFRSRYKLRRMRWVDFRPRTVAFTTGISATSGTAHGSSLQLHLFELRFLVLTVSSLPRARRSASEAQDVQVQIFPVGRAFSAVLIFKKIAFTKAGKFYSRNAKAVKFLFN